MDVPPSQPHSLEAIPSLCRRLGVIVLTDNRPPLPFERPQGKDFRGSAFKETEVDPLEFPRGENASLLDLDLLAELNRRVAHLEERVEALHEEENTRQPPGKRNRRKFDDLVREHECLECRRKYGSETALKNHAKLKHGTPAGENEAGP